MKSVFSNAEIEGDISRDRDVVDGQDEMLESESLLITEGKSDKLPLCSSLD